MRDDIFAFLSKDNKQKKKMKFKNLIQIHDRC